jgi:hypothetical protein
MAVYNVHGGHNRIVPGASSYLDEVTEDRKITAGVISLLRSAGHTAYDCTDDAGRTAGANLANIVAKCNAHAADLDISIHQNAALKDPGDGKTKGVEVFVYSTSSKAKAAAERVCRNIAALGFTNRGVKVSTGLYVLRNTKAPAMLIETCFVDDKDDADLYNRVGVNAICKAIAEGIMNKAVTTAVPAAPTTPAKSTTTNQNTSAPSYTVGKTYTAQVELNVRKAAGTGSARVGYSGLTANAKTHDKDKDGAIDKGTRVTCQAVKKIGNDIWMKIPSGWIAAYYNGKVYVK